MLYRADLTAGRPSANKASEMDEALSNYNVDNNFDVSSACACYREW